MDDNVKTVEQKSRDATSAKANKCEMTIKLLDLERNFSNG